jgi:hypothetical protein
MGAQSDGDAEAIGEEIANLESQITEW